MSTLTRGCARAGRDAAALPPQEFLPVPSPLWPGGVVLFWCCCALQEYRLVVAPGGGGCGALVSLLCLPTRCMTVQMPAVVGVDTLP